MGGRGLNGLVGEVREEVCSVAGFQVLTTNMAAHIRVPQAYPLMLALILGQPVKTLPTTTKVSKLQLRFYAFLW